MTRTCLKLGPGTCDAIAEIDRFIDAVGDEENGGAGLLPDIDQLLLHTLTSDRVERSEGFIIVENQKPKFYWI
jgi:hypothetical protein